MMILNPLLKEKNVKFSLKRKKEIFDLVQNPSYKFSINSIAF